MKSAVLTSTDSKELILGYFYHFCYPINKNQEQLKISVRRHHIATNKTEVMYTACPLLLEPMEIIIDTFTEGKRICEMFIFQKKYEDNEIGHKGQMNLRCLIKREFL
ncbi:hypothetical protein [Ascidiimonas sp. W6]|uniref:hypothetical protein n=1 Tax=Ascidiimonas meishanensis TaxID=3128903 RepID=UPI0030EEFD59